MRWNNATQTAQILFGLGVSTWRAKGRGKDRREGEKGGNRMRARKGEAEGGRERKEGEGKASMLGSKWEEEAAMHLRMLVLGPETIRGEGGLSSGFGMEGIVFSARGPHPHPARTALHILPEQLIHADLGGGRTKRCIEVRLLEYQHRLLSGFGRDLSSTTESPPYIVEALPRACLHREARAHSVGWDVGVR